MVIILKAHGNISFLFSDRKFKAIVHSQHVSRCFSISAEIISMSLLSYFHFCLAVSVHMRLNNRISHNVGVTGDETCWWHLINEKVFMKKFVRDQWRASISFNIGLLFEGINLKTAWNSCDWLFQRELREYKALHTHLKITGRWQKGVT